MEKQTREQTANAGLKLSRRTFVGAAAMAAAAGGFGASAWASAKEEVERLKAEGWEAHPVACCMAIAAAAHRRSGHGTIRCASRSP